MTASLDRLRRARAAIFLVFFVNGAGTGLWAGHIPIVRDGLRLGEAALGLALLLIAAGAMATMPFAAGLAARLGSARVTTLAGIAFVASVVLPLAAPSYLALLAATLLYGACTGAMDVAMNAQAAAVQKGLARPIMSSCHAGYSLGAFAGAGLAGILLWLGGPPVLGVGAAALMLAAAQLWAGTRLLGDAATGAGGPSFVVPRGAAWLIGLLALLGYLIEGAVLDWSAILLADSLRASAASATAGFASFSVAMTIGRLTGDAVVKRLGERTVLIGSGLITAAGLTVALGSPSVALSVTGFTVTGLGLANVVPILFTAGARTPHVPPAIGVAMVATLGYLGILAGPALIGFAAELMGLRAALTALVALGLVVALAGRSGLLQPRATGGRPAADTAA
jgi:predicted MFS family arabinose efflux permease